MTHADACVWCVILSPTSNAIWYNIIQLYAKARCLVIHSFHPRLTDASESVKIASSVSLGYMAYIHRLYHR